MAHEHKDTETPVRARPARRLEREYLAAIEPLLSEWATPEDAEAYDGLKPL